MSEDKLLVEFPIANVLFEIGPSLNTDPIAPSRFDVEHLIRDALKLQDHGHVVEVGASQRSGDHGASLAATE